MIVNDLWLIYFHELAENFVIPNNNDYRDRLHARATRLPMIYRRTVLRV